MRQSRLYSRTSFVGNIENMKIAILGAHHTGKTTLAEALCEALNNYSYQQEPWFHLEERGHNFSDTPQADDFVVQLEYSLKMMKTNEPDVVFDRCPIDFLMYLLALGSDTIVQQVWGRVEQALAVVDLLVLVPIEQNDVIGCPKNEFPELREAVDSLLEELINDFDIPVIQVAGSVAQRKEKILRYMKGG